MKEALEYLNMRNSEKKLRLICELFVENQKIVLNNIDKVKQEIQNYKEYSGHKGFDPCFLRGIETFVLGGYSK